MMEDVLLNLREASNLLKVSIFTLRNWIYTKKLPYVKLGRRVLLKTEDLQKLVEQSYQKV